LRGGDLSQQEEQAPPLQVGALAAGEGYGLYGVAFRGSFDRSFSKDRGVEGRRPPTSAFLFDNFFFAPTLAKKKWAGRLMRQRQQAICKHSRYRISTKKIKKTEGGTCVTAAGGGGRER
jgi:hypothetical protein